MRNIEPNLQSIVTELVRLTETQREQLMIALQKLKSPASKHPVKITQLAGLGKEMWRQVDVEKYIQELRDEWSDRKV
ncbi:MAG TPA: hypothetical protein DHV26_05935 [Cytophagales bacterium]|nr:hypothetical protein [Cytophagales bacterium]